MMKKYILLLVAIFLLAFSLYTITRMYQFPDKNPFFGNFETPFKVPPFEDIQPGHFKPAFLKALAIEKKDVEAVIQNSQLPTFENTIAVLDKSSNMLRKVSGVFFNQIKSNSNKALRQIQLEMSSVLSQHRDDILLNTELFLKIESIYSRREVSGLTEEETFIVKHLYQDFLRNGVKLPENKKKELKTINNKLTRLVAQFEQNLLTESGRYKIVIDNEDDLKGLPELVRDAGKSNAKDMALEGKWVYTTRPSSMFPFLTYSQKRDLREKLYTAYINRANNNDKYDNKAIVSKIIKLRAERSKLLGYKTHAHLAIAQNMAKKPEIALSLLHEIWNYALPLSKLEAKQLQDLIEADGDDFKLASWDWWYYTEKIRKAKYNLNLNELLPYFKLENVRDGAFWVANKLYGIQIHRIHNLPLPHPDAQAFEINESNGKHIGILYMDFHPRTNKKDGAWCVKYREHHEENGKEVYPIVSIECNFLKPGNGTPSLLNLSEAKTLFHEFGHALDALFSKKSYHSGYYARDFIELPSQIMENWVGKPEVLRQYAIHFKSGEVIPDDLIEKIKSSSSLNQGFTMVKYIAASLLDLAYHTLEYPVDIEIDTFEDDYFRSIGLIPEIVSKYRSTYFSHIIGNYAAGYYGYAWSKVLEMDAFAAFEKKGFFDQATALSFRENILERNGIESAKKMFVDFSGYEPPIGP